MNRQGVRKAIGSPILATGLLLLLAGTAFATVASNFTPALQSRGTLTNPVHFNTDGIKFQTKDATDFITVTVTIGPSGSSGWHTHPGIVLVTVAQGTLTVYDTNCVATIQPTGSSFIESGDGPLLVLNESATLGAVVHATYIEPAGTTALRIDQPQPGSCAKS